MLGRLTLTVLVIAATVLTACTDSEGGADNDGRGETPTASPTTATAGPTAAPTGDESPTMTPPPSPPAERTLLAVFVRAGGIAEHDGQLVVEDLATGQTRTLADGLSGPMAVSPDGRRIAYVVPGRQTRLGQLRTVAIDGTGDTLVAERDTFGAGLAWSPDGDRLAFSFVASQPDGGLDLAVIPTDGGDPEVVVSAGTSDVDHVFPAWSPNGELLAFKRLSRNGAPDAAPTATIEILDVAADESTNISQGLSHEGAPTWDPTGDRIAVAASTDGQQPPRRSLFVIDRSGGQPQELAPGRVAQTSVAWSPEGAHVAVSVADPDAEVSEGAPSDLGLIDVVSGEVEVVADGQPVDLRPSWAPDASLIAFAGRTPPEGPSDLFVVAPDGSGLRQITSTGDVFGADLVLSDG